MKTRYLSLPTGRELKLCAKLSQVPLSRALLGFVSRQEAEEFLKASEVGTFLIRFSDSELGGVTVAWSSCEYTSVVEMATAMK